MITLENIYWKRDRHCELDKFRTLDFGYNISWYMFFGTCPPGANKRVVKNSARILTSAMRSIIRYRKPSEVE